MTAMLARFLVFMVACSPTSGTRGDGLPPAPATTDGADTGTTGESQWSFTGRAYQTCISDAECDPGSACTSVPGHATSYCAPACTPDPETPDAPNAACATDTAEGVCLSTGRCAQSCAEVDRCDPALACADVDGVGPICAGEEGGTSGYYGTCSHPQLEGADCPPSSSCYGGELLGIEDGICLPWCDDNVCQPVPDGTEGVTPICYDVGLDHPVCALLCTVDDSVCPDDQACLDLGFIGLCAPDGTTVPFGPAAP